MATSRPNVEQQNPSFRPRLLSMAAHADHGASGHMTPWGLARQSLREQPEVLREASKRGDFNAPRDHHHQKTALARTKGPASSLLTLAERPGGRGHCEDAELFSWPFHKLHPGTGRSRNCRRGPDARGGASERCELSLDAMANRSPTNLRSVPVAIAGFICKEQSDTSFLNKTSTESKRLAKRCLPSTCK